jgi:hypothetical protein
MRKNRDIAICVIFSIVTCGIYGLYWMAVITDDIGEASGNRSINGATAVLFEILTCGIYGIYWAYKMGENISIAKEKQGIETSGTNMAIVYLVLQICKFGIINCCLMQSELNKLG